MLRHIRLLLSLLLLTLAVPSLLSATPIDVGQLVYSASGGSAGLPSFTVYNFTGNTGWGCNAGYGTPVCDSVSFTDTSLVVTFADNFQATASPDFAFGPGGYLYGDNPGDDPAQSFLFDTSQHGDIVDAVFSGTFSPSVFDDLDGGGTFTSTGTFTSEINLLADGTAGTGDAADIDAIEAPTGSPVPEPASWWLLATGLGGLYWFGRRRESALFR